MSEVNQETAQEVVQPTTSLADAVWGEEAAPATATVETPTQGGGEEGKAQEVQQQTQASVEAEEEIVDADEYLRNTLGFQSWDEAKKEIEELKKLKEQQSPGLKFESQDSERLFAALQSGKEDEVYEILSRKKEFERIEKLDISSAENAAEVVKMSLRLKHPQLDDAEIRDIFEEQYAKYPKPIQGDTQTDEEYEQTLQEWQNRNEFIDRKIIRDAKIAKPEVLQMKTKIELPEIKSTNESQSSGLSQEELAKFEEQKQSFVKAANETLKSFNGFKAVVKDKDVEIPVAYDLSVEEKGKVQQYLTHFAENGLDANAIFADRWLKDDGSINSERMAKDLALLLCEENITQKYVNDAAAKRLEHFLAEKKNVRVTPTPNAGIALDPGGKQEQMQAVQDFFWNQT